MLGLSVYHHAQLLNLSNVPLCGYGGHSVSEFRCVSLEMCLVSISGYYDS